MSKTPTPPSKKRTKAKAKTRLGVSARSKSVEIGAWTVPIRYTKIPDSEQAWGYYEAHRYGDPRITLDARLTGKRHDVVRLHEILHAIDDLDGVRLSHKQIEKLSERLVQVLKLG